MKPNHHTKLGNHGCPNPSPKGNRIMKTQSTIINLTQPHVCIGFHEKVFKLRFGFILICGDWDRASMRTHCFGPGLDPVARNHNLNAERCHLVIEV
jgi:hypothetical protein